MEKEQIKEEKLAEFKEGIDYRKMNVWQKMSEIQGLNIQINKDKLAHGYSYATLDQIMDKLNPLLHKVGLLVTHKTDWNDVEKMSYLQTTIMNVDNPTEVATCLTYLDAAAVLPGQNKIMVIGSQITYFRRYHVTSMFGLTTETDTDAGGAIPNKKGAASGSVESAGSGEKTVDFVNIFKNMIAKGKDKATVQKQFETYKVKMNEAQITEVTTLIGEIK
jgi:hypothetical protein